MLRLVSVMERAEQGPVDLPAARHRADNEPVWPGDARQGEIEVLDTRVVWASEQARLLDDRVRYPTIRGGLHAEGRQFRLAPGEGRADGVVVVPVTRDDRILLVRQFRHAVRRWVRELPRGITGKDERPADAARRELWDELGCRVESVHPLGTIAADTGQLASVPVMVVARVADTDPSRPGAADVVDVVIGYRYDELKWAWQRGDIIDAFTLCAVVRLEPHFVTGRFVYLPEEAPG